MKDKVFKFKVTIEKDGLVPETLDMKALGSLICNISELMENAGNGEVETSLSSIEANCVSLNVAISTMRPYVLWLGFQCGLLSGIPLSCNSAIEGINSFVRKTGAEISFHGNRRLHATANPGRLLIKKEKIRMKYQTTLFGQLIEIGGKTPNAHVVQLGKNIKITCSISRELATELAPSLYQIIGLDGEAESDGEQIISFKASSISPYKGRDPGVSPLQGLKDMGAGKYYDGINPLDYVAEARGRLKHA